MPFRDLNVELKLKYLLPAQLPYFLISVESLSSRAALTSLLALISRELPQRKERKLIHRIER